ncbi:hypothetical protein AWN90_21070 [Nocardia terpenica]|uniref:Uncharacterized protein n=1 Tax=Nocardia terpenica TaxID=455432 RepID=A0A161XKY6_9NOCA|nr:hypothetical protein AWN90_21070 [Nocardia terpenica]
MRSSDLEALTGFVAAKVAEGYQAGDPFVAYEDKWQVSIWRSAPADPGRVEIEAQCTAVGITYMRESIEHVMRDNATHDDRGAIKLSARLSGADYVSVQCNSTGRIGRLLLMDPGRCNHGITVCRECVGSWEIDYDVRYSSTQAGRELSAQRATAKERTAPTG